MLQCRMAENSCMYMYEQRRMAEISCVYMYEQCRMAEISCVYMYEQVQVNVPIVHIANGYNFHFKAVDNTLSFGGAL